MAPSRPSPPAGRAAASPRPKPRTVTREPVLDVHEIQGNILAGFNKDSQSLLAVKIRDVAAARRWLLRILPHINSMDEVLQFNALFRARRARLGRDPAGMVATWANVAFSRGGIAALTSPADADALPDVSFQAGLVKGTALALGDPVPAGQDDPTKDWVVGGTGRVPDVLLIVAGDDHARLLSSVAELRPGPADGAGAPEVVWEEEGRTRPDLPGHEHFGFKDGVSQPGVRGLASRKPEIFVTPRTLQPPPDGEIPFARPGQPLVWPGQFVLGYPTQDLSSAAGVPAPRLKRAWFKNGSFLVFRRLTQNVAGFAAFVRSEADRLAHTANFPGMTPERLGALLVGRWASGAPVSRTPLTDKKDLADEGLANNDFFFTVDTPAPAFLPGVTPPAPFDAAKSDASGLVCPLAAHIRKVNPRDQDSNLGPAFDTLARRILRRGIPFGPPLANPSGGDDGVERGLHFLCYQTSIVEQFEKLQVDWANNPVAPQASGGVDLIIGQTDAAPRTFNLFSPDGSAVEPLTAPIQWVVPTGGGYFFAPSISAIRDVLARPAELA